MRLRSKPVGFTNFLTIRKPELKSNQAPLPKPPFSEALQPLPYTHGFVVLFGEQKRF